MHIESLTSISYKSVFLFRFGNYFVWLASFNMHGGQLPMPIYLNENYFVHWHCMSIFNLLLFCKAHIQVINGRLTKILILSLICNKLHHKYYLSTTLSQSWSNDTMLWDSKVPMHGTVGVLGKPNIGSCYLL